MTTPAKVDNEVINEHGKPYNNTSFIDGLISNFHLPKRENGSKVSFFNFDTQKHSIPKTPTIKEFSNYIKESKPFKEETKPTVPLTHYKTKEFKPIKVENAFTKNMNIATIKPMQHKNPQYYEYKLDKYKDMTSLALRELDKQVVEESGDYNLERDSLEFMDIWTLNEAEKELNKIGMEEFKERKGADLTREEEDMVKETTKRRIPDLKKSLDDAQAEVLQSINDNGMIHTINEVIAEVKKHVDGLPEPELVKKVNIILNKYGEKKLPPKTSKEELINKLKHVKAKYEGMESDSDEEIEEENKEDEQATMEAPQASSPPKRMLRSAKKEDKDNCENNKKEKMKKHFKKHN